MALMTFREPNQVQWRGVRPAHDGTQVTKNKERLGAGNVTIHTVSVDCIFFLTFCSFGSRESVAAEAFADVRTQPIGALAEIPIISHMYDVAGHQSSVATFNPPLEIDESITIRMNVTHANVDAKATIHGWEELK